MNKKIVIGGLLCAVGLGSIFGLSTGLAFGFFGSTIDEPLKEVSFTRGGDMQGSFHGMTVRVLDDKNALVCYEDAKWHNEAVRVKEYIVPKTVLDDIKTIFNEHKLAKCENAPMSEMFAYDAATSSYYFDFEKKRVKFSSNQKIPVEARDALRKISACVSESCQKGERLPGLVLEPDAQGNMPIKYALDKGKLAIKVVCYRNKILSIAVGNDTEEEKELSMASKIIDLANPSVIVAERITSDTDKVPKHYNDEYSWKLDKRLDAGKYSLTLGGYTTEFEIK